MEINGKGKFRARKVNVSAVCFLLSIFAYHCHFSACSAITGPSGSVSPSTEGTNNVPLLSTTGTVEDYRFPLLAHGFDDDLATHSARFAAENYV